MPVTFRPITESEWQGYQGALAFEDGTPPLIGEYQGHDVIIGSEAISLFEDHYELMLVLHKHDNISSARLAKLFNAIIETFPDPTDWVEIGLFEAINC